MGNHRSAGKLAGERLPRCLEIMDLPILTPTEVPGVPRLAAYAEPWARVNVFRSPATSGYLLDQFVINRSTVDIINIGTSAVVRTTRVGQPSLVYTSAMQVADFGGNQAQVKFAAYQISLAYGRGTGATRTVP